MVMENMDDNKEKVTDKFAKMGQNFFKYVFYAFALSDSNDADRNLNWRNVKQMVPTRFGIREGLIALQELRMLTLVSHSVPRERHRGDLKKMVLSFLIFCTKQVLSFFFKS